MGREKENMPTLKSSTRVVGVVGVVGVAALLWENSGSGGVAIRMSIFYRKLTNS
jgi:hypothetical protein